MIGRLASTLSRLGLNQASKVASKVASRQTHLTLSHMPFGASRILASSFASTTTHMSRPLTSSRFFLPAPRFYHKSASMNTSGAQRGPGSNMPLSGPFDLVQRLFSKTYALDTRLSIRVLPLLIPSIVMTCTWLWYETRDNKDGLRWMERHFQANLNNLWEGRYYTLLTSCVGAHGEIIAGGLAEACTFLLFGGNLLRSYGISKIYGLYFIGHLMLVGTTLMFNYIPYRTIEMYQANLTEPGKYPQAQSYTPRRDRRTMVLAISRKTNDQNPLDVQQSEAKQREILRMPEKEFLVEAKKYYAARPAIAMGGGTLMTLLGLRLHSLAMLPLPYVPVPIAAFVPLQLFTAFSSVTDYTGQESTMSIAPLLLTAFVSAPFLPRHQLARFLPAELVNQMRMSTLIPRHEEVAKAQDVRKAAEAASELAKKINLPQTQVSAAQIDAMRKRNAKFQGQQGKK